MMKFRLKEAKKALLDSIDQYCLEEIRGNHPAPK